MTNSTDPVTISLRITNWRMIRKDKHGEVISCNVLTIYTPIKRKRK